MYQRNLKLEWDSYTKPFENAGIMVTSASKRKQIMAILHDKNAGHYQRLWMVGFLKSIGCTDEEIVLFIKVNNHWPDFSLAKTTYQVKSIRPGSLPSGYQDLFDSHPQREDIAPDDVESILHSGHDFNRPPRPGGDNLSEWRDIGEPKCQNLGYGKFLEVCRRTNGKTTGIVIANGQYGIDKDGNADFEKKQYKNRIFLSEMNGTTIDWLVGALEDLRKESE